MLTTHADAGGGSFVGTETYIQIRAIQFFLLFTHTHTRDGEEDKATGGGVTGSG